VCESLSCHAVLPVLSFITPTPSTFLPPYDTLDLVSSVPINKNGVGTVEIMWKKLSTMQGHDSQERMEAGSPRAAAPPVTLDSRPLSSSSRSAKRRRVSPSGSPSTSQGSSVTTICSGATDTFDGRSNTVYKRWQEAIQPTTVKHEYVSFFDVKVVTEEDGVWTTGKVQCLFQGIQSCMTRPLPANSILSNKSQTFSIVWEDNTDSICDLQCLLTYVDNYVNKRHKKADATRSSTTNGSACRSSNGSAAPSSLPSSSSLPQSPLPPHNPQESLRESPQYQGTSSIDSQGQDLLSSSANGSTRSVFLSSVTFVYLE
jgi:hypothetical protein